MASDTLEDGGGAAGTFWSTFGGPVGGEPVLSPLEQLLQSPDCSVEALLDEDDIIQEFKSGNDRLLQRLCQLDACRSLIDFITHDPPEEASDQRCFRYPFVSVELMTCGSPQLLQFFVSPDSSDVLLNELWSFVEVCEPSEINPTLAGYFQRAVAAILSRHTLEMVEYLRKRGADALLERFLERLHLRSLAELFARLLCVENPQQLLFPVDNLVLRLLKRLEDPGLMSDTQENISLIIQELLAHKESLCYSEELMAQLTEPASVRLLVDHVFGGRASCTSAAISILNSVLHNSYMATVACVTPGTNAGALSPCSPPLLTLNDDDVVNFGADDLDGGELTSEVVPPRQISPDRVSPPASPSMSHSGAPAATLAEARSTSLMREVSSHLPRIRGLICASLEQTTNVGLPVGTVPAVGCTILEVLSLLTTLVRTGSTEFFEALLFEQLLPRCFEIFFRHPWSSLLHNSVRNLLSEIMSSLDGTRTALVLCLLREGALLERIINEYAEEERYRSIPGRKKHPRVGYMGILHNMCLDIREYGTRIPEVGALLASVSGWTDTVLPAVSATSRIHASDLGGGVPDGDKNLASSSATMGSSTSQGSDSKTEDDFVLDDLQDDLDHAGLKSGHVNSFDDVGSDAADTGGRESGSKAYLDSDFNPDFVTGDALSSPGNSTPPEQPWVASFADFQPSSGEALMAPVMADPLSNTTPEEKADASAASATDFGMFGAVPNPEPAADPAASPWAASFTENPQPTEDWAAFDSAFAPSSASAETLATSAEPINEETLLNFLSPAAATEKRDDGSTAQPWSPDFSAWGQAPSNTPAPTAVPSSTAPLTGMPAPTKAPTEDLTWNPKFSAGPEAPPAKPMPVPSSAAPLTGMDPWSAAATGVVGTENLFALLEQDGGGSAFSGAAAVAPVSPYTTEVVTNPLTAPPVAGLPDVASPWPSMPVVNSASQAPMTAAPALGEDPFAALMAPKGVVPSQSQAPIGSPQAGASNADRSWVADFDPLG